MKLCNLCNQRFQRFFTFVQTFFLNYQWKSSHKSSFDLTITIVVVYTYTRYCLSASMKKYYSWGLKIFLREGRGKAQSY